MPFTQKQTTETAGWWWISKSSDLDTLGVTCLSDIYCRAAGYVSMELRKEVWGKVSSTDNQAKERKAITERLLGGLFPSCTSLGKLLPSLRFQFLT